jgi:hypothetical protein
VHGLAFRGSKLYVVEETTASAILFHEVNPASAAIVATVNTGIGAFGEGDLTFRSDGVAFYWVDNYLGADPGFFSLNITVPSFNLITTGPSLPVMDGMAFDSSGTLYGLAQSTGNIYTINTTTGALTLVGGSGQSGVRGALAFSPAGTLYACFSGSGFATFCTINPATGAATVIGSVIPPDITGLAFAPPPAGVTVTQSGGTTNVDEAGSTTDSYTAALNSAPTSNVTITLNGGGQVTTSLAILTFTPANWNVPQSITVAAIDDTLVEGTHTGTITHTAASTDTAYNGIAIASVTANITDDDGVTPPTTPPSTGTGKEGAYTGAAGPSGNEGAFGFSGRMRPPSLAGPFTQSAGRLLVLNVAHRDCSGGAPPGQETAVALAIAVPLLTLVFGAFARIKTTQ